MAECKKASNLKNCNCSFSCERKGICCDCLAYHRKNNELPACYFSKKAEKEGDRSLEAFLKDKGIN